MSSASVGVLLRSLITLEQEGADVFFGEPSFEVADLMRMTPDGKGVISLLELSDVMAKPRLFSTFMLWMLAQLYQSLPEAGDLPKPKLAFFFDEAHLLFADASDALMQQVELTVRLIRSKGVGVYFVTQAPTDVPPSVLAQLGNRVQHALRAFTPQDADNLRKTARTFPMTDHYDVEKTITSLGIGEALVTVLSAQGHPHAARRDPPAAARFADGRHRRPRTLQARVARRACWTPSTARPSTARAPTRSSRRQVDAARAAAAAAAGVDPSVAATMTAAELRTAQKQTRGGRRARPARGAQGAAARGAGGAEGGREGPARPAQGAAEDGARGAGRPGACPAGGDARQTSRHATAQLQGAGGPDRAASSGRCSGRSSASRSGYPCPRCIPSDPRSSAPPPWCSSSWP